MNREETDIAALRENYSRGGLEREDLADDPLVQFRKWLEEAVESDLKEPNAVTLATISAEGQPSIRTVLLKGLDERGFASLPITALAKRRNSMDRAVRRCPSFGKSWSARSISGVRW